MLTSEKTGVKFPIQLDGKGDVASLTGLDLEKADMLLLLGIEHGELPWDHNKGTLIRELLHSHVANRITARAIAFREVTDQINTYSPKYVATATEVEFSEQQVSISVEYAKRDKVNEERTVLRLEVNR